MPERRRTILNLAIAAALALASIAPRVAAGQSDPDPVSPMCLERPVGHAHNDYYHDRPLLDALEHRFVSIEADVFPVDGQLMIAHDRHEIRPDRTLRRLYIEPLADRARRNGGRVFPERECPVLLHVDIKDNHTEAYRLLEELLAEYPDIFTSYDDSEVTRRAVTVFINIRSLELARADQERRSFINGYFTHEHINEEVSLIPILSEARSRRFSYDGDGQMHPEERDTLRRLVRLAHDNGKVTRFWGGAADRPAVWREQMAAGVHLINTDRLADARDAIDNFDRSLLTRDTRDTIAEDRQLPDLSPPDGARARIVSHRGANKFAPENTFAAFELCDRWGLAYVEVDVRTTRDGVPVIMHDTTLDRTTDATGTVERMTWADLETIDAGAWFGPEFRGEPVPRLDEFIAWARGADIGVYLDVKDADHHAILRILDRHRAHDRTFFWSRDRDWMRTLREIAPHAKLKVNKRENDTISDLIAEFDPQIIEFDRSTLEQQAVREVKARGITAMLYTPDNDPALFRNALEQGIDYFNIDHLDTFRRVQRQHIQRERR